VPDAALLVLSRALPSGVCQGLASAAGLGALLSFRLAALQLLHTRGPMRSSELAALLERTTAQGQVAEFRRLGLVTLTGPALHQRLSLTTAGTDLATSCAARRDMLSSQATLGIPTPRQDAALQALRSIGARHALALGAHFPIEVMVALDILPARLVSDILMFIDSPELGEAALRPLLILAQSQVDGCPADAEVDAADGTGRAAPEPSTPHHGGETRPHGGSHLQPTPSGSASSKPAARRLELTHRACWRIWGVAFRRGLAADLGASRRHESRRLVVEALTRWRRHPPPPPGRFGRRH